MTEELLPPEFYARDTLTVARDLLGAHLCRGDVVLRVTEVEAYCPGDSANHCYRGRTNRNAPMFGPPGHAYVFLCYGLHHLLNLVTMEDGVGTAVLIRACEPVAGHETVAARRNGITGPRQLTGPGKVGAALGLDLSWNDHPLYVPGGLEVRRGTPVEAVLSGPRVGIDYAEPDDRAAPWRLAAAGTRWVSRRRELSGPAVVAG